MTYGRDPCIKQWEHVPHAESVEFLNTKECETACHVYRTIHSHMLKDSKYTKGIFESMNNRDILQVWRSGGEK